MTSGGTWINSLCDEENGYFCQAPAAAGTFHYLQFLKNVFEIIMRLWYNTVLSNTLPVCNTKERFK